MEPRWWRWAVTHMISSRRKIRAPVNTTCWSGQGYSASRPSLTSWSPLCRSEYIVLISLTHAAIWNYISIIWSFRFKWKKAVYFYERNGHYNVAGLHTCHLVMQSLANTYRHHNLTYTSFVTDSSVTNMTENLKREIGLDHASKCIYITVYACIHF